MEDGFFATLGFAGQIYPGTVAGLAGNWRERTITGGEAGIEAMAFLRHELTDRIPIQVFLLRGFTDASPDMVVGTTLGYRF